MAGVTFDIEVVPMTPEQAEKMAREKLEVTVAKAQRLYDEAKEYFKIYPRRRIFKDIFGQRVTKANLVNDILDLYKGDYQIALKEYP